MSKLPRVDKDKIEKFSKGMEKDWKMVLNYLKWLALVLALIFIMLMIWELTKLE